MDGGVDQGPRFQERVGGGGGANFATCVVFLLFLTCTNKKKGRFVKDALWGGEGTHQSWPGGRGGRPRALVAGEGWGGRRGRMAVPKKGEGWGLVGCCKEGQVQAQFHRRGQGLEGFGSGRVGVLFFESWRLIS